jgi:hypothetical protein
MVEIALGPKGAFENSNIGPLTRRVSAEHVVIGFPREGRKARGAPDGAPRCKSIACYLIPIANPYQPDAFVFVRTRRSLL